jgi:diadenosine tetraphosphate (Ap4A) HIT family hydrolase
MGVGAGEWRRTNSRLPRGAQDKKFQKLILSILKNPVNPVHMNSCPLCHPENETVLWRDQRCRVILADDADYPGFCRVVWDGHVKEMSDLAEAERMHLLAVVFATEKILRELLNPDKMNLATLGNQVPHLHWHVIPRFTDDPHFPDPVWAVRRRGSRAAPADRVKLVEALKQRLSAVLTGADGA